MTVIRKCGTVAPFNLAACSNIFLGIEDAQWRPWNIRHLVEERTRQGTGHHLLPRPTQLVVSPSSFVLSLSSPTHERYHPACLPDNPLLRHPSRWPSLYTTVQIFEPANPAAIQPAQASK
ncbi:hypothetical protein CPC08DRAFT_235622 [Agrocybe pediades]|nr:hypothetical protein CPC08DRAFT_235622 [Agrocybe pediades]